ncbi:MAG: hypothetical protein ACI4SO_04690, partial [Muribaculaceae bacterium]
YIQANAYSGSSDDWDGYEKKGAVIADMRFRNVVRAFVSDFDGVDGSVPASFIADEEISHSFSFNLPENVDKANKCHIVVMLIDMTDRHIINACTAPLANSASVTDIFSDDFSADSCYEIFRPDGLLIAKGKNLDYLLSGRKGLFIVKCGHKAHKIVR